MRAVLISGIASAVLAATSFAGAAIGADAAVAGKVPVPVRRMLPAYPLTACFVRISGKVDRNPTGTVKAELTVQSGGTVGEIRILSEEPEQVGFAAEAEAALRLWQFEPGRPGNYKVTLISEPPPDPKPVKRVNPRYPSNALAKEQQGLAVLAMTIAESGAVERVDVMAEYPKYNYFGENARAALLQYEFAPGRPGQYCYLMRFSLEYEYYEHP